MATWTSQQTGTGNWSRPSNETDSPWYDAGAQAALSSYPGALGEAGDVIVTVAVGHTLTFDVSNDVGFKTLTVNGVLNAKTDGTILLSMTGTVNHIITGSGTINFGTSAEVPVAEPYSAKIDLGAASRIVGTSGLKGNFYADLPTNLYCKTTAGYGVGVSTLAVDTDLTDPGNIAQWIAGRALVIANVNRGESVHRAGSNPRTIASVAGEYHNGTDPIPAWAAETVTDIDDIIRPTTSTGYLYKCIAREGDNETGTEEPTDWPTTVGLTQVDGDITWECIAITKAITLNRGLASAIIEGAIINLTQLNVEILTSCANKSLLTVLDDCSDWNFRAALRNTTNRGGYGFCFGSNNAIYGPISCLRYGLRIYRSTVDGTISGCTAGCGRFGSAAIGSMISGCTYGVYEFDGFVNSIITGCGSAVNTARGILMGLYVGNEYGINAGTEQCIIGAEIRGNTNGINAATNLVLTDSCVLKDNTNYDINSCYEVDGTGASLQSGNQVVGYSFGIPVYISPHVIIRDPRNPAGAILRGRIMAWVNGGYTKSVESADFPVGMTPTPVSMDYAHLSICEFASVLNWVTVPVFARANVQLKITVYVYIPAALPSDFDIPPTIELLDPGKEYSDPAAVLDSDVVVEGSDVDGWYTLQVSYTPTYDGQFTFRVKAQEASDAFYWFPVYEGASVPTLPDIADVRDGESYGYPETPLEGTLDLPAESDVKKDIKFDNETKTGVYDPITGNFTDPGKENVLIYNNYIFDGVEQVAEFDEAARNTDPGNTNVRFDVVYKTLNEDKVGAVIIPNEEDVREGVSVDFSGVGILDLPAESDVKKDIKFDNETKTGVYDPITGNFTDPGKENVLISNNYIFDGVEQVAEFDEAARNTDPGEVNVRADVEYKILNETKTGTLEVGTGTIIVSAVNKGMQT